MFEKIKAFFKKYKLYVLITFLVLMIIVPVLIIIFSEEEEVDIDDRDPFGFDRGDPSGATYENYDINFSEEILRKIDGYSGEYLVFEVKDIDHFSWAETFAETVRGDLEYREQPHPPVRGSSVHVLDQTLHYWELGDEVIHYDVARDIVFFKFETPTPIPNINIDPESRVSVENALIEIHEQFFSSDFVVVLENISEQGDLFEIEYSRYLDDVPVRVPNSPLYLTLTSDGKLKEGRFLLAEFEEASKTKVFDGEELRGALFSERFRKDITFNLLDPEQIEEIDDVYGFLALTGEENGIVNLEEASFSYEYINKFSEIVSPKFLFKGQGLIEIEGEDMEAEFTVKTDVSM